MEERRPLQITWLQNKNRKGNKEIRKQNETKGKEREGKEKHEKERCKKSIEEKSIITQVYDEVLEQNKFL